MADAPYITDADRLAAAAAAPPRPRHRLAYMVVGTGNQNVGQHRLRVLTLFADHPNITVLRTVAAEGNLDHLLTTRFCLMADGVAPWSPRLVQYMVLGCVPVMVSDQLVPPFDDVLDWSKFSVRIPTAQLARLPELLAAADYPSLVRHLGLARPFVEYRHGPPGDEGALALVAFAMHRSLQKPFEPR